MGKMSATTPDANIIGAYKADLIFAYSAMAALTIVCYEFIATFRYECELVWTRKWTGATWLFLVNRYSMLVTVIVEISPSSAEMSQPPPSDLSERVGEPVGDHNSSVFCSASLGIAGSHVLQCLSFTVIQLSVGPILLLELPDIALRGVLVGCISPSLTFCAHQSYSTSVAGFVSTIATDLIAIVITWIKTYRHVREASAIGASVSFSAMLLQYGSLYFIVLFVVDLAGGLILLTPSLLVTNPMSAFTIVLPNIILSRFLINLRQVNAPDSGSAAHFSRFSPQNFRMPSIPSIIGNLGEPLADNEDNFDDENYVIAGPYEDGSSADVNSGKDVGTSNVMYIDSDEIEEVPKDLV
ncbi:hypothetical protein NM688_g3628 [Phlebia brevispora]|uniref:Uncharacterized protein n=1 Tax=Phlebia brevispora TaxID=194682 RepID=A0ACC1T4Z9_9APHY|nr:hypothetical protein NM688_g3628 [Phlebia brevispora]